MLLGRVMEQFAPPHVTLTMMVVAPLGSNTMFSLPAVSTEDEMAKIACPDEFGVALKVTVPLAVDVVLLAVRPASWVDRVVSGVWKVEVKFGSGSVRLTGP